MSAAFTEIARACALMLFVATGACVGDANDEGSESSGSATTEGVFAFDVGVEQTTGEPVLTEPTPSIKNLYALATLSSAAYFDDAALHDALCEYGLHPVGSRRCFFGRATEAEVTTFDTAGDDHAIYVHALVNGPGQPGVAFVAFRGTASTHNLLTNLSGARVDAWGADPSKDLPGAAHRGFSGAASRLSGERSLGEFLVSRHSRQEAPPLYFTGHSLGAAIATVSLANLLYGECARIDPNERFSTPRPAASGELAWSLPATSCPQQSALRIAGLATFGSPRVGDAAFAQALANMMALRRIAHVRVVNADDIVARVAPLGSGYAHLHLDIRGLSARGPDGLERRYAIREDERVGAVTMRDGGRCRQWEGASDSPPACPTHSLAYLLPREAVGWQGDLRFGMDAAGEYDARMGLPSAADHKLRAYIPFLRRLANR